MTLEIGLAGTGKMGSAMAHRLLAQGFTVTVWNRTRERCLPLQEAGARIASSSAELSASCDVVISSLTNEEALKAVYQQPGGLLESTPKCGLFIEMSTVRPATQIELARAVRSTGARFIECPVGGTVGPAREGRLLGLVGGAADDLERARPVLEQLCRRLVHVGEVGHAAAMKLAINLPLILSWQALGEALLLIRDSGIDPALVVDLLADSSGATTALRGRSNVLLSALAGAQALGAYDIDAMRKDLDAMLDEARDKGLALPLTQEAAHCYARSAESGWGAVDGLAQAAYWTRFGSPV